MVTGSVSELWGQISFSDERKAVVEAEMQRVRSDQSQGIYSLLARRAHALLEDVPEQPLVLRIRRSFGVRLHR